MKTNMTNTQRFEAEKIIGCMLQLLDNFSTFSTEVFLLLFSCQASEAFV